MQVEGTSLRKGFITDNKKYHKYLPYMRSKWRNTVGSNLKDDKKNEPYSFKHGSSHKFYYAHQEVKFCKLSDIISLIKYEIIAYRKKEYP